MSANPKPPLNGSATSSTGWTISWETRPESMVDAEPSSMDFVIKQSEDNTVLKGFIKWDGCSNWMDADGGYFHLCGLDHLENLYDAMTMCYQIAGQHMPEADE